MNSRVHVRGGGKKEVDGWLRKWGKDYLMAVIAVETGDRAGTGGVDVELMGKRLMMMG
jgi:hypothetical protein